MTINTLFYISLAASLMMTGLIWLIQLVHYPSFHYVDSEKFQAFENFHAKSITIIVFPLMLCELITASLLIFIEVNTIVNLNFASVIMLWLMTLIISMPKHKKLTGGYDKTVVNQLVLSNWPRTLLWSLRSICLSYYFVTNMT